MKITITKDKWIIIYSLITFGSIGLLIGGIIGYIYIPYLIKYEHDECFEGIQYCHEQYNNLYLKTEGKFNFFNQEQPTLNMTEYINMYSRSENVS